jgi:DNA-binding response OmpR family regulator
VDTSIGGGTRVCVTFRACEAAAAVEGRTLSPVPAARPLRILLVEDDASVRRRLEAALGRAGHGVISAGDAHAGERLAREHRDEIDVLVSDVVLPGPSGPAMVARLVAQGLRVPIIFMSGYSSEEIDLHVGGTDGAVVLQKPFPPEVLLERLARVAAGKVSQPAPAQA